ncbi:MAG: CHASE2 domain-containing protein [Rariglobus sp.]
MTGVVLGLAANWLPLRRLEWLAEEFRLKAREQWAMVPPTGEVVLLAVDEETLATQKQWPFLRSVHGQLMEFLGKAPEVRPAVMSWDFVFTEETYDPKLDAMFADSLGTTGYPILMGAFTDPAARGIFSQGKAATTLGLTKPLVLPEEVVRGLPDMAGMQIPILPLLKTTRFMLLDADADEDGVIRKIPLIVRVGDRVFPGLAMGTLMTYWHAGPDKLDVKLGDRIIVHTAQGEQRIPIDERGFYHLNYRYEMRPEGGTEGIPVASYQKTLDELYPWAAFGDAMPKLPVSGKILVVGQTATGLTDIGPSPLRSQSGKVLVHLNAIENILREDYLVRTPVWPGLVLMLVIGLGTAWVLDRTRGYYYTIVVGLLVVAAVGNWGLLIAANLMVPLAVPLVAFGVQQAAVTMLKIREEQANRDRIRGMFATYVSPALVDRMVRSGEEPKLGGVEEEITAYFSDIESFSSFSEKLKPQQLVELMNEYLTACTDIVQAEGGTLDKYIGDALVAMYGAPLVLPNHGHRAVVAALRVHRRCDELRTKWKNEQAEKGWPDIVTNLQTRIGLNVGRAVVGNMGSHTRFNYTMMGDTVNLAARMESGAKAYGVYTLVTESVVEASRKAEPDAVLFRPLDRIVVKGRTQPAAVFEAMALRADAEATGGRMAECAAIFAEGLARYYAQDWEGARALFARSEVLEAHEKNNPSKVMLERVALMRAHPPGADWDGVWRMTSK